MVFLIGFLLTKKLSANKVPRFNFLKQKSYVWCRKFLIKENFIENTEFADIYNLAVFDRKLRFIVFNALQQIEISYRAAISNVLCKKGSSH